MGAVKDALAYLDGEKDGERPSHPPPDSSINSANNVHIITSSLPSRVIRDSPPTSDRRRKPVRRNSTSLEAGSRNDSNADDEKYAKRKDKRRSSDGIPSTRGKPRIKRGRKTEDRLPVKDEVRIPRTDKGRKVQRKRPHTPISSDDERKLEGRVADRVSKTEPRKAIIGRSSARVEECGPEECPKRRRVENDPYPDPGFDGIGNSQRKTDGGHRAASPGLNIDLPSNSKPPHEKSDRGSLELVTREEKDPRRQKEAGASLGDRKRSDSVIDSKHRRPSASIQKRSPKVGSKGADFSRTDDDLNDHYEHKIEQEKHHGKNDNEGDGTRTKTKVELRPGALPASPSLDAIPKSRDVSTKGDTYRPDSDPMTDDEKHSKVDSFLDRREDKPEQSENSDDDPMNSDRDRKRSGKASQTNGTWDLERIADYVPDRYLAQPYNLLSHEQLLVLLNQRETELRRCRLQLWRADCKLKKDQLSSPREVEISLKRIENLVNELMDWAHTRHRIDQDKKRSPTDGDNSRVLDFCDYLSGDDKITFHEKEEKICEAAHDIRRIRFDPDKADTKSLAERLFKVMQVASKVSRRASLALKNMVALWADIYMFNELMRKQGIEHGSGKGASEASGKRRDEDLSAHSDASDCEDSRRRKKVFQKDSDGDLVNAESRNMEREGRILNSHREIRRSSGSNKEETLEGHKNRNSTAGKNPLDGKRDSKLGVSHGKWSPYDDRERSLIEVDKIATNANSSESGAHSVEEEQPNREVLAERESRKEKAISRHRKMERPRSSLNGTLKKPKGSEQAEDSGHSTSGDEFNQMDSENLHSGDDRDQKGASKRIRTGMKKQGNDKRSAEEANGGVADDAGLYGGSKPEKTGPKGRRNGSNNGDDGVKVALSNERQRALITLRSQMHILRKIRTMVSGDRGADVYGVSEVTEKLVHKRCANGSDSGKYDRCIKSVLRAIQQLLRRKYNENDDAKLVEEDEVAVVLKKCFASTRKDLPTAVGEFLNLCLKQTQTAGDVGEQEK